MYTNINSFASAVAETIKAQADNFFPNNIKVSSVDIQEVTKGNDIKWVGLVIRKEGSNIAPNIYLESFFDRYLKGEDMDTLIDEICEARVKNDAPDINTDDLTNLDKVKDKITCKVICKKLNEQYLTGKPHKVVEDLAVMYIVNLGENDDGQMTMPVTDGLLKSYNLTLEELDEIAMENLAKSPIVFKSMYDVMKGMVDEEMYDMLPPDDGTTYVLTNQSGVNGAAAILDKATMDFIAGTLDSDFIILPSSIHEVIIVKATPEMMNGDEFNDMVNQVNDTCLDPKEILSDHAYIYTKENGLKSI